MSEEKKDSFVEVMYCVEYYSDVSGSGVREFNTQEKRDMWLIGLEIDNFFLYEKKIKYEQGDTNGQKLKSIL